MDNNDNNEDNGPKNLCKYCLQSCEPYKNPGLQCSSACASYIHVKCLKRGGLPGSLIGDVFFDLNCGECSPIGEETITRVKMSWLSIIILTLYNLRKKSSGISKRGYFHWKSDISTFVDKNWDYLFQKSVKRKKNWIGTISGTLSHYSTTFFKSGTPELGESGWWRLMTADPPEVLIARNVRMIGERKKQSQPKIIEKKPASPSRSESSLSIGDDNSNCTGGESSRINTPSMFSREYVQPSEVLSDFLLADDEMPDIDPLEIDEIDMNDQSELFTDLLKDYQSLSPSSPQFSKLLNTFNTEWMNEILEKTEKMNEITENTDNYEKSPVKKEENDADDQMTGENSSDTSCVIAEPQNSLFTINPPRACPWKRKNPPLLKKKREKMSKHEISYFLQKVNKRRLLSAPPPLRRLYRKLSLIKMKHDFSLPILDLDKFSSKPGKDSKLIKNKNRVIDRFYNNNYSVNSEQRLQGHAEPTAIHSPYTNRVLKPFIRQDTSAEPLWLRVMEELTAKVREKELKSAKNRENDGKFVEIRGNDGKSVEIRGNDGKSAKIHGNDGKSVEIRGNDGKSAIIRGNDGKSAIIRGNEENYLKSARIFMERATIDYCYVRPQHIPAMNSLCSQFFWEGIDLTECLQYPDFTCVVLYKKIVVGFAILVPDVGYNEAYISFFFTRPEWRRCGIGTFMLYHLIQTCMGKDLTLHVSVTNPALILYQKFGFKVEEFVQDFYDKYMAPGPRESRHALFLRLSR